MNNITVCKPVICKLKKVTDSDFVHGIEHGTKILQRFKLKLFAILATSNIVVSVGRHFTERTISLVAKTPNG